MKKSEMHIAQGELQAEGEQLEAPISLTPEQLENVAGGIGAGVVFGFIPLLRLLLKV